MKRKFLSILLTAVILITLVPLTGIKNEQAQTNAFASTAFTTTPMLSTGSSHTTALKSDGTVWTWGNNGYSGKLGDGTNTNKNTPVQVQNLTNVIFVSTISHHIVALKSDGTVWAWGNNEYGQLGDDTNTNKNTPVQVQNLTNVIAVSAGHSFTAALKSDGTVWAWGRNLRGQLGDGTNIDKNTPVQVQNLTNVDAFSVGYNHTTALKSDGTVWAWGDNYFGPLGDGTNINKNTPVQVQNLTNVIAVSAGAWHTTALKSDGTVWAWGENEHGSLGDGTNIDKNTPVQVQNLTNIIAVSAGAWHTTALKSDGTIWAWGQNHMGQLGDGTTTNKNTSVQVQSLTNIDAVSAGHYFTAALKSDGTVWAWGDNEYGQLGDGTNTNKNTPVQVLGENGILYFNLYGFMINATAETGGTVSGSGVFAPNATVTLLAATDAGYVFDGWYSGSTRVTANTIFIFNATENRVLEARFIKTFTINAVAGPDGTVSGGGVFNQNAAVTLTATANSGFIFDGWYSGSTRVSINSIYTFFVTENRTLQARFSKTTYAVTYNANSGSGAPSPQTKTHGETLIISSTRPTRTGYDFLGWAHAGTATTAQYQPGDFYTVDANGTLYAVWQPSTYTVTYNANNGTGAPSPQTKTHGVTLTISSTRPTRTGYNFLGWATSSTATTAQYQPGGSYTANENLTLYAVWQRITYNITATALTGGTVSGGGVFNQNAAVTLTATANAGYTFDGWFSGNTRVSANWIYTFNATANRTLQARFIQNQNQYTINVIAGTGGKASGGGTFSPYSNTTLMATANTGYTFDGWYEGNVLMSIDRDYYFTVISNSTIQARFTQNKYTVTAKAGKGGKVTGGKTVNHNAAVTLRATANRGYKFDGWFEGKNRVSTKAAFTFKATANRTLQAQFKAVKVKSVKLNRKTANLKVNKTLTLKAMISPNNALNKKATWRSSNSKIAAVKNGKITARKRGTVTITVTTADGRKTAKCKIKII